MSESVLPVFSSRSFIISGLIFSSLIYFEFINVYGVRTCSSFTLLQVVDQFSQHHLFTPLFFCLCLSPLGTPIKWREVCLMLFHMYLKLPSFFKLIFLFAVILCDFHYSVLRVTGLFFHVI